MSLPEGYDVQRLPEKLGATKTNIQLMQEQVKRLDKEDPTGQLVAYKQYMTALNDIDKRVRGMSGVKLKKHIKTNMPHYPQSSFGQIVIMAIVGAIATVFTAISWSGKLADPNMFHVSAIILASTIGYAAWFFGRVELRQWLSQQAIHDVMNAINVTLPKSYTTGDYE